MKFARGFENRLDFVRPVNDHAQKQHRRENCPENVFLFRRRWRWCRRDSSRSPHYRGLARRRRPRVQGARRRDDGLILVGEATTRGISGNHGRRRRPSAHDHRRLWVAAGRCDGSVIPQIFQHFAAILVSLIGLFFQRPHDHRANSRMNRRINLPRRHRVFVDNLVDHRRYVLARKRLLVGHHFIEHYAQRENVAAPIDGAALDLFRRHIAWRAHDVRGLLYGAELQNFCRSKVRDLDGIVGGEHQVRGLDVAVNYVAFMRELQRAASLLHDAQRARQGKRVAVVKKCLQALAFH